MELLVSLIVDILFLSLLLGGASNVYLLVQWWHLPHRWTWSGSGTPRWLRRWQWGWKLLIQGGLLTLLCGYCHPRQTGGMAIGIALAFASNLFWIAAAYAYHLTDQEMR